MSNPFDFMEDTPGQFTMKIADAFGVFDSEWPMTRKEAEELLFQMAFILGYKVG